MIELDHVTRLYGTVLGVNDVCLSLPAGGYGLVGPNGSGKTTLLHLLMGLLRPSLGTVRVFGQDPERNKAQLSRIGYCPSLDGLYGPVTGFQWVRYLMELHGIRRGEAHTRTAALLEQVGMGGAMHRAMGTYSRGMRQRIKLAQAVAHDPELLILDEPFNGLDPIARHDITMWLREWIQDGKSLILASHVLHEVESVTTSFLLICGGRLLASGEAQEIHGLLAVVPNDVS
ncbi:MAG TPA: ABC transporter ATP-binding protein, partial [Pirellulaceae bacterium]